MNKLNSLLIGILGLIETIYFLVNQPQTETVFGFRINGWLFMVVWALITIGSIYSYIKFNKK